MHRLAVLVSLALAPLALTPLTHADIEPHPSMLRWPDVSATHICFVYANDLWMVPREGGVAAPIASPQGMESFPRFSPDGKAIAFVGNYEGNTDLYTLAVAPTGAAGQAVRATYHPGGETLCDWTNDGKLLFLTNAYAGLSRQSQLFLTNPTGGMPEKLPVPYAGFGAISPDGTTLAYTLHSTDTRTWKRYRGGMSTDVWLFNLKDKSSKRITDWEGTDTIPMWIPGDSGTAYFLSDAGPEHRLNIWAYDIASGAKRQITQHTSFDVRWPSPGPGPDGKGEFVYQLGAELRLLSLGSGQDRAVKVTIPGDRPSVRERLVDVSPRITGATISPGAKRVAIEARGDLWSAPAKEGAITNLTRTNGVFERDPAWSPDGRWIAYFSDESGEYELWIRPSGAKAPEKKDDKEDDKKDEKKDDAAKPDAKPDEIKAEGDDKAAMPAPDAPRKLTDLGPGFRFNPVWSPDSKRICFVDRGGKIFITEIATGTTSLVDTDPNSGQQPVSWSHDSAWLAYARADEHNNNDCIWLLNVATNERHRVTDPAFSSTAPAFDAKGDWLYFASAREFSAPVYSDLDTTFVYNNSMRLYMTPLRADVKNPWLPKNDEETIREEKKEAKKDDKPAKEDKKDEGTKEAAVAIDPISGTWEGTTMAPVNNGQPVSIPFVMKLTLNADGSLTGTISSAMGSSSIRSGSFDKNDKTFSVTISMGEADATITGTIRADEANGTWSAGNASGDWTAKRTSKPAAPPAGDAKNDAPKSDDKAEAKKDDDSKADDAKAIKIEVDGFERRTLTLPVGPGRFYNLRATGDGKLLYVRAGSRGSGESATIKIFDPNSDERDEKTVTAAGGFELTADRKKLLVSRGTSLTILDAAAGGGKAQTVPTSGMTVRINPRDEWAQILHDAYRIFRDYFYEPTMHGVDWKATYEHYRTLLPDCATREDVNWVIAEMISELNVGHAYVTAPGDVERGRSLGVGLLGCDFELARVEHESQPVTAYRISRIIEGGAHDADARGPLSQPGVNVKAGDFLLAVDGVPVDTSLDPYAAFIDRAGRTVVLSVSDKPVLDGSERQVVVTTITSESNLRFRDWIDAKRRYVHEKTGGKVGYIYVPNTGVDGQNELFRQFNGERGRAALIIDERWNGGGQIPTRFIELLNRPALNYWAVRDGKDWTWPPDAHNGPKCMLINGLAGSGGDMFPALFRQMKIGPLIGTRTWGGLVGISGNPGLIDGGAVAVPTFGYYETDGTWGIEGHGVDPDVELIDDPALMQNDGDPQLDRAISMMLEAITKNPYTPPTRPASPNRAGMGLDPKDK
ncbi:MAG: PD40 domain-containing protein [Phycisphaerales bacterium]|nr:PD40 domain-containing protein [Phycisphaerales bacterium]